MSDKMEWWAALVEWESCGLDDIPTENLLDLKKCLDKEVNKRFGIGKVNQSHNTYPTWNQDNSLHNVGIKRDE